MSLALPCLLLRLYIKGARDIAYRQRWSERLGRLPKLPQAPLIWVHAVSVGEALAALALIHHLKARHPSYHVHLTCTTPHGSRRILAANCQGLSHSYLPFDLGYLLRPFIKALKPKLLILMETELWPNMIHHCRQHQVPVCIANGRLSPRSQRHYGRIKYLMRQLLSQVTAVGLQSEREGPHFAALGLEASQSFVMGNLKFDQQSPAAAPKLGASLADELGHRPCFVAASTHAGEEKAILEVFKRLRRQNPQIVWILVPRHPERCQALLPDLHNSGFTVTVRSKAPASPDTDIYLCDTLGELEIMYAAAQVAFIGGSLVAVGCHNMLEAALLAKPIIVGPHTFNFVEISMLLEQAGALQRIGDSAQLEIRLKECFANPEQWAARGQAGLQAAQGAIGAANRFFDGLRTFVEL